MIRNVLIFIVATFIIYACASSKKVVDISIGSWDFVVKNTPEGDFTGTFIIAKEGDNYTGSLNNDQENIQLENISVVDKELTCYFDYQGYQVTMTGMFEEDTFSGKCTVEYNDFPMTATRQK